jgi:hypothetical protein
MTTGSAPAHTASAASRGRKRSHSLLVTPRRGGLRTRQAHGTAARRRQGGNRQQRRDNDAQNKMHDAPPGSSGRPPARRIPVSRVTHFVLILNWTKRFQRRLLVLWGLVISVQAHPRGADFGFSASTPVGPDLEGDAVADAQLLAFWQFAFRPMHKNIPLACIGSNETIATGRPRR